MLKQSLKAVVVLTASAVAVPYALAVMANMIYGWPPRKGRYGRALHPKKVYALNYVLLQELAKVRFIGLAVRWKYFYNSAGDDRIVKDLPYGSRDNSLDVYIPQNESGEAVPGLKPVVVFVYGGTWGSGDKNMYSLLCAQLADKLGAVVCCPNYSIHPKGYVDDMVQDMVDCLTWILKHGEDFGGDKKQIMMIGHSAGAHLCVMAALELTLKKLLHHPEAVLLPLSATGTSSLAVSRQSSVFSENIRFDEKHFNGSSASSVNGDDLGTSGSFYVVEDKGGSTEKSFVVLNNDKEEGKQFESGEISKIQDEDRTEAVDSTGQSTAQEEAEEEDTKQSLGSTDKEEGHERTKEVTFEMREGETSADGDPEDLLEVQVTEKGDALPELLVHGSEQMTKSQQEASDILSSLKLVIGLAGVYQIAEHYEHEYSRGIEDVSAMSKAMYGPEHFDRLSPTLLVSELPNNIKLPPLLLVHGDMDKTVPLASSLHLGRALWEKGCYDVSLAVIPGCGHLEICLDLMDPKRPWYDSVMSEILKGAQKCL